jgi:hypothetical protein
MSGEERRTIRTMVGIVAAAWTGLAEPGKWDFSPLGWAALLLLAAWGSGVRLRWWAVPAAFAGGLPCATLAGHFGALTLGAVIAASALILRPVVRAGRS